MYESLGNEWFSEKYDVNLCSKTGIWKVKFPLLLPSLKKVKHLMMSYVTASKYKINNLCFSSLFLVYDKSHSSSFLTSKLSLHEETCRLSDKVLTLNYPNYRAIYWNCFSLFCTEIHLLRITSKWYEIKNQHKPCLKYLHHFWLRRSAKQRKCTSQIWILHYCWEIYTTLIKLS